MERESNGEESNGQDSNGEERDGNGERRMYLVRRVRGRGIPNTLQSYKIMHLFITL